MPTTSPIRDGDETRRIDGSVRGEGTNGKQRITCMGDVRGVIMTGVICGNIQYNVNQLLYLRHLEQHLVPGCCHL